MMLLQILLFLLLTVCLPLACGWLICQLAEIYRPFCLAGVAAWFVFGSIALWGLFQLIAVPMIWTRQTLTLVSMLWLGLLILAFFAGIIFLYKKKNVRFSTKGVSAWLSGLRTAEPSAVIWLLAAAALILFQCWTYIFRQHIDFDDSRFVVTAVDAYFSDTMLQIHPATGELMTGFYGELSKDLTSPWMIYMAMLARFTRLHPAVIAHTLYPPVLLLVSYAVYWLIAGELFPKDRTSRSMFLAFAAFIQMFFAGTTKTHSVFTLIRIWQGKACVACIIIPLLFLLFIRLYREPDQKRYLLLMTATGMGASLMSGMGVLLGLATAGLYGFFYLIWFRRWRMIPYLFAAVLPEIVYGLIYLGVTGKIF